MGGGWRTKGGVLSHCVLTEVHKHPQFTCQASMVADIKCSLTSVLQRHIRTALHSGLLLGHRNDAGESRPGYL